MSSVIQNFRFDRLVKILYTKTPAFEPFCFILFISSNSAGHEPKSGSCRNLPRKTEHISV